MTKGDINLSQSYHIEHLDEDHTCMDSVIDKMKEDAIRQMKDKISNNPVLLVYDSLDFSM